MGFTGGLDDECRFLPGKLEGLLQADGDPGHDRTGRRALHPVVEAQGVGGGRPLVGVIGILNGVVGGLTGPVIVTGPLTVPPANVSVPPVATVTPLA